MEQLQLQGAKHKTFILARKAPAKSSPEAPTFLIVDYGDVDGLAQILEDYGIETVISTLNLEHEAGSQAQLNLIAAADRSRTTRRIIPSEFLSVIDENDPNAGPGMGGWIPNALALKKTNLEYIRISIGFFSDYWGMPHIHSHLKPFFWGIDLANGKAVIPGTGNEKFTVTYSGDLAKVIVKLLDEEKWPERGLLSGSDISFNELLAIAESIRGSKFDVVYDPLEKLKEGRATLLWRPDGVSAEEMEALMSAHSQMVISGACQLPLDGRLDNRYPDLCLMTAEQLLSEAWTGKL
ncbi:unnamed protein product [Penicillium olsonii]|uniref:NmrA-like domain-containing protein n=1 Tax=Penicillium olsonii TaxID=99116 RepID=A0A9W4MPU4_PENOL|nr:unnamed protein product [Penicillium olsonii]CAG8069874.1 unnamed protein product [Penicillium olsonii]